MIKSLFLATLVFCIYGCVTTKVYYNSDKMLEEARIDQENCAGKEYAKCMANKGYRLAPEAKAKFKKAFLRVWINPGVDFKKYEAVFVENVDISEAALKNQHSLNPLDQHATKEEAENIALYMQGKFREILWPVIPVEKDRVALESKPAMIINLKLTEISGPGQGKCLFNPVFCMEGKIIDSSTHEELVTLLDKYEACLPDKDIDSLKPADTAQWQAAYTTIELWADNLASILALKRNQAYNSLFRKKTF